MCMIDSADGGSMAFSSERFVKAARKPHKCEECRRDIAVGESYWYSTSLWEGDFSANHVCLHCRVACDWLSKNCSGYVVTMVEEDIAEHVEEYHRMDLARLAVGMRRKWQRFHGGLMSVPTLPRPIELGDARG